MPQVRPRQGRPATRARRTDRRPRHLRRGFSAEGRGHRRGCADRICRGTAPARLRAAAACGAARRLPASRGLSGRSRRRIPPRPIGRHTRNRTGRCRSGRQSAEPDEDDIEYERAPGAPAQAYPPRPRQGANAPYQPVPYEPAPDERSPRTLQPYPQQQPQQAYPQQVYPQQSYPPAEQVPLGRERGPVTTGAVACSPRLRSPVRSSLRSTAGLPAVCSPRR